jgi:Tfp pilus assembly protein PilF
MELGPTLAESHFAMALFLFWLTEDWPDAEPHFKKALEIQPRSAMICGYYGTFLAERHRYDEAETFAIRSTEFDPLSAFVHAIAASTLCASQRFGRAIEMAERSLELSSDFVFGLWTLGLASGWAGSYTRSVEAFNRALAITNRAPIFLGLLGLIQGSAGHKIEAQRLLDEVLAQQSRQHVDPIVRMLIYVGLDDRDKAYEEMELACKDRSNFPNIEMLLAPALDAYATEPRFQDLFRRLRLVSRSST